MSASSDRKVGSSWRWVCAAGLVVGSAVPAWAVTKTWVGPNEGDWVTDAFWSPSGEPGDTDEALLNQAGTYEVRFAGNGNSIVRTVSAVSLVNGNPTIELRSDGQGSVEASTLNVLNNFAVASGASARLTQLGGGFNTSLVDIDGALNLGSAFSAGSLEVNRIDVEAAALNVGVGSVSTNASVLSVTNGGLINAGPVAIGSSAGSSGQVNLSDGGIISTGHVHIRQRGGVTISTLGSGIIAGSLTLDGALNHLNGSVEADTFTVNSPYFLAGDARLEVGALAGNPSNFNWSGGDLTWKNSLSIDSTNAFLGSNFNLSSSQSLRVEGQLNVGTGGAANIVFGGEADANTVSIGGGIADGQNVAVTVTGANSRLRATALNSGISVGDAERVDLSVLSGGSVFVEGQTGITELSTVLGGTTDVLVSGNGSSFFAGSTVAVGGTTTGARGNATVTLLDGGLFSVSGALTIWETGTLNAGGGNATFVTLDLRGNADFGDTAVNGDPISLNGGTLSATRVDYGATGLTGSGTINAQTVVDGDVNATGALTFGDASRFDGAVVNGILNVGNQRVEVRKKGFFTLGNNNVAIDSDGELVVPDGVLLPAGAALVAPQGRVNGRFVSQVGSVLELGVEDGFRIGDAGSVAGFNAEGEIHVGEVSLTIDDANDAVLGTLTTLGGALGDPGFINAGKGITLGFGRNLTGHGTVNTPDDPFTPLINNGSILGDSPTESITLAGYVKGVGTLDHVTITGTDAPGFSPATVYRGNVNYAGTLEAELGGTADGESDRLVHSGVAQLGGVLDVSLINGYTPTLGDTFELITAAGGVNGAFSDINTPALTGLSFDVVYTPLSVLLEIVAAGLVGDYNDNGQVEQGDLNLVLNNWGQPAPFTPNGAPFVTATVDQEELNRVLTNWGATAAPSFAGFDIPEPAAGIGLVALGVLGRATRVGCRRAHEPICGFSFKS